MTHRTQSVRDDEVPAVVTHLRLRGPLGWAVPALPDGLTIDHVQTMTPDTYRALFRLVGAEWLWQGRLRLSDADLERYLADKNTEIFVLRDADGDLGLADLNHAAQPTDLAYFGLARHAIGRGLGRALIGHALRRALERSDEIHVQTCTLDHPGALSFYRKCGFEPVSREIEIMKDPRLSGLLDRDAAPQIPLLQ